MSRSREVSTSSVPGNGFNSYSYLQDAIKIHATMFIREDEEKIGDECTSKLENKSNTRKFSIDPSLTDFLILKNIIGRAFDLKGDFVINYKAVDDYGILCWLPLVSDWDLGAAFLTASSPDLQLMIETRNVPLDEISDEPCWDIIKSSDDILIPSPLPISNHHRRTVKAAAQIRSQSSSTNSDQSQSKSILSTPTHVFNTKINTSGIFNTMERWVQKAKTFVEDISVVTTRPPLSDVEFRNYLDSSGILIFPRELRYACFHGGVEPSLRRVVWKHLLNVYPDGLTGKARIDYIRKKSNEYFELRDLWKQNLESKEKKIGLEELLCISNMVRKDVLRTDRHVKFFAGQDDNQNVQSLFYILTTFALNHPSVSYCQGMSDLASPLLVIMNDEAQAYICFCALMERLAPNFNSDGLAMSLKFSHLSEALAHLDSDFWAYLKSIGGDDLLFCYRWLLLEMKREFAFDDALRMIEVLWSSIPYRPSNVSLFEVKYTGSSTISVPIPVPCLTSSYSKVCAIRRSSTTLQNSYGPNRIRRYSRAPHRKHKPTTHLSLDENSLSSISSSLVNSTDENVNGKDKTVSLAHKDSSFQSQRKPFYSLDEAMEVLSCSDFPASTSPFEILNPLGRDEDFSTSSTTTDVQPKLIKNLREFWTIGKLNSSEEDKDGKCQTTTSSKSSVFMDDSPTTDVYRDSATRNFANQSSSILQNTISDPLEKSSLPIKNSVANGASDSENDSGHCCENSYEIEEGLSVEEAVEESSVFSPLLVDSTSANPILKLPSPDDFGGGNPFLMFLCLTMLLQHRDHIIRNQLDYNETAMYFDKMVRKHNVVRVLASARSNYSNYLKHNGHLHKV